MQNAIGVANWDTTLAIANRQWSFAILAASQDTARPIAPTSVASMHLLNFNIATQTPILLTGHQVTGQLYWQPELPLLSEVFLLC